MKKLALIAGVLALNIVLAFIISGGHFTVDGFIN